ncbi:hypothetical protein [Streptomyces sp. NPDC055085]
MQHQTAEDGFRGWRKKVTGLLSEALELDAREASSQTLPNGGARRSLFPWLVTFRLSDGTLHSYVIKDACNAADALQAARIRANTSSECKARGERLLDDTYNDVLELGPIVRWGWTAY